MLNSIVYQFPYSLSVNCQPIPLLNGTLTTDVVIYHTDVSLSCDFGFYLDGAENLQCIEQGQWNNTVPSCQSKYNST